MTTETQVQAIISQALFIFARRVDTIYSSGYSVESKARASGLARDTFAQMKEGLMMSNSEESKLIAKMMRLVDEHSTFNANTYDPSPQLDRMSSEVLESFNAFRVASPDMNEEGLQEHLALLCHIAIFQNELLPFKYLSPWYKKLKDEAFKKRVTEPLVIAQDEFATMNEPQLLLREPEVETIEDLIHVLGMMVISDVEPYNALFSNQLIRFRLTNGQTALGLLGEGDYFVIHQTSGRWEIIDGVIHDYNDEYNKLPDRLLKVLLRYALLGLAPKDLLEHVREGRQTWNLEKQLKSQLEQHESILNLIS